MDRAEVLNRASGPDPDDISWQTREAARDIPGGKLFDAHTFCRQGLTVS